VLILITYTFTPLLGAEATGINNNGDIVGYELDNVLNGSAVSPYAQGYLYSHGQYTLLRPNPPESTDLIPRDVNDSGEIVGIVGSFSFIGSFVGTSFLYTKFSALAPTWADGVDDTGKVVGYINTQDFTFGYDGIKNFFFSPAVPGLPLMNPDTVLQYPGATSSFPLGINNSGQVVGYDQIGGTYHGFLYINGAWSSLDDPAAANGTFAEDINDSGMIVGYYVDANGAPHGFEFNMGAASWTTIDYPGASQTFLNGINDTGQIVGTYIDGSGRHALEVTPNVGPVTDTGFDPQFYLLHNPDVAAAGVDPYQHYLTVGWKQGRDPNQFFSTTGYLNANPDVKAAGVNPLLHYDQFGWKEGRDPSSIFDTQYYLIHAPDVAAAGTDPLVDYLRSGMAEGRLILPAVGPANQITPSDFDPKYYLMSNPDVAAAGVDPYQHFLTYGWKEARNPDALFDTQYYLAHNPDIAAAGVNPLLHYDQYGWQEGRDPSASFSTSGYLAANPDVAGAHVDPLQHFLTYGLYEARLP
jgi:probable HAF family extracellular repeat protein